MIEIKLTIVQNNWLEATWTEVTQAPDVITPAVPDQIIPAVDEVLDDEGNVVTPAQPEQVIPGTPEQVTPGQITRTELKHTSYHPTQLDLLQADAETMGTSLGEHADMLADWVASYAPPEPEPTPVPQVITMRQARLVLHSVGLLDDVEAAVQAADRTVQIEWEYATEVRRTWPTLLTLAATLGLTDENLDGLFIQGATL